MVFTEYYNNPSATKEAFTSDGWFRTGDRGYVDSEGKFNLSGRFKEVIVVNGVKYAPQEIETTLELAGIQSTLPAYFAVFAHRPKDSDTEGYCVVYGITSGKHVSNVEIAEHVAKLASTIVGVRPDFVVPLEISRFDKSSIGKLSRTKIKTQFENGVFHDVKIDSRRPLTFFRQTPRKVPVTPTEKTVVKVLAEMQEIPEELISIDQTVFELGMTLVLLSTRI